jgi:hypothetical protein
VVVKTDTTRFVRTLLALLALTVGATGALVGTTSRAALAAVDSGISYDLVVGDPTLATRLGDDGTPCVQDNSVGTYRYRTEQVRVDATGDYVFTDDGPGDGVVGLYTEAFDPDDLATGCLAYFESGAPGNSVTLAAGTTYTLVQSTPVDLGSGSYSFLVSGPGALTVLADTQTVLNSAPDPSKLSKPVTLTAQVTGGTPTGIVQFRDGATVLGSAAVSSGLATLVTTVLPLGTRALSATYVGDDTTLGSVGTTSHLVEPGAKPKVVLTASAKRVVVGSTIKLRWSTKRTDKLKAAGAWKGRRALKGSKTVKVSKLGVNIYKLKAYNVNGLTKAKVKVQAMRGAKDFEVSVPREIVQNGTELLVRASGFDRRERFKIFLDDVLLLKGFAAKSGDLRKLVTIPALTAEGPHTLAVVGSRPNRRGEVELQVIRPKELDLVLEGSPVPAKSNQTVVVEGLVAGEKVTLSYDGVVLTQGVADATGAFSFTFNVGNTPGKHTLTAVGQIPERTGEVTFKVQKPVIG